MALEKVKQCSIQGGEEDKISIFYKELKKITTYIKNNKVKK